MMIKIGAFFFRFRDALFPVAFLVVFLPGPRLFSDPLSAAMLGFAITAAGQFVRAATIGLRYIRRGGKYRRVYAEDLVTEGLYSHSRNPMYVGNLAILVGVAVASNSWACVAVAVPFFLFVYSAIIAAEEAYLRDKFGAAFDAYMRDVPRWLPLLDGLGTTLAGSRFHWRRVLVKEYNTPFGWVAGICVIALWNLSREGPLGADANTVRFLVAVIIVAAISWAIAWILKKTGTVVPD